MLVQDIAHPARLVIPAEMQRSHPVREILESHPGTVRIGDIMMQFDLPAVAQILRSPHLSTALVTDDIKTVATRTVSTGMTAGHHPEIVPESNRHGSLVGNRSGPDGVVVQKEMQPQTFPYIETESNPRPMYQRILDISDTQRFIIAECSVEPDMLLSKRDSYGSQ